MFVYVRGQQKSRSTDLQTNCMAIFKRFKEVLMVHSNDAMQPSRGCRMTAGQHPDLLLKVSFDGTIEGRMAHMTPFNQERPAGWAVICS
jgi:hypothetical protein